MFRAYSISPDIYWVGALEWDERYIHGFTMPEGSTNNAYLIMDEKVTLIDTCIGQFSKELVERITDIVDPAEISYIVSNHSEKDHAGSIGDLTDIAVNATVVTSDPKGLSILKDYYGAEREFLPVKSGDTLNIGKRTLKFIHTPFVHWPDNMVTYSEYDKCLFSNDAFGQFYATSKRFDDEVDIEKVYGYAKKYFANIVLPFAKQTAKALDAVKGLDIRLIAPSHGIIWRSHIDDILNLYSKWSASETREFATVVFASSYGSTKRIAEAITEAFMAKGIGVRLYDLDVSDISDIMADAMDSEYVALGSSTHNATVLPRMGELLTYIKGLSPKGSGRVGIPFGSYGWAAKGTNEISDVLASLGYSLPEDVITTQWDTGIADEEAAFDAVVKLIEAR